MAARVEESAGPRAAERPPFMLTAEEVARDFLRTSRKAVYEMARLGRLPGAVRIGRKVLFRRDALLNFLRERESSVPSLGGPSE